MRAFPTAATYGAGLIVIDARWSRPYRGSTAGSIHRPFGRKTPSFTAIARSRSNLVKRNRGYLDPGRGIMAGNRCVMDVKPGNVEIHDIGDPVLAAGAAAQR